MDKKQHKLNIHAHIQIFNCHSRLGQTCNHIAGLLFRIEAANNLGITSSTSSCCGWNVPTDKTIIEPALMKDLVELTKKSKHGRPGTKMYI